jgi:hypothetical protein
VSELESWIHSDLKKLDKQDRIIMKELTLERLNAKTKEIALEADRALDRTIQLRKQAKESAFKIKSLEEKVEELMLVLLDTK